MQRSWDLLSGRFHVIVLGIEPSIPIYLGRSKWACVQIDVRLGKGMHEDVILRH
jgi:hypothetical protein